MPGFVFIHWLINHWAMNHEKLLKLFKFIQLTFSSCNKNKIDLFLLFAFSYYYGVCLKHLRSFIGVPVQSEKIKTVLIFDPRHFPIEKCMLKVSNLLY